MNITRNPNWFRDWARLCGLPSFGEMLAKDYQSQRAVIRAAFARAVAL